MASLPLVLPERIVDRSLERPATNVGAKPSVRLSPLEWSVVAMAQKDRLSSIRKPGPVLTALGNFFRIKRPTRLASEHLEAVRRIAVLAWHHRWNVPKSEVAAFLEAGFSIDHYELIQARIGQVRTQTRRGSAR